MPNEAIITFTPQTGILYVITYKKSVDTFWITPPNNPTNTSPFIIDNVEGNVMYDFRLQSDCGIETFQGIFGCPGVINLTATNI